MVNKISKELKVSKEFKPISDTISKELKVSKEFKPIEDKILLRQDNRPKTPTIFHYQRGNVGDKIALRIFKGAKVFKTLVKNGNWDNAPADIWDLIYFFGGQRPDKAKMQREHCLTTIVINYFNKFGYKSEEQPKLCENTPDLKVYKGKSIYFIELKAYFGRTIVGESESAQVLKYYGLVNNGMDKDLKAKIERNEFNKPKFLLIHSGKLVPLEKNALFNDSIKNLNDKEEVLKIVKAKYRGYIKALGRPNNMESRDTRGIYYHSWKKIPKYMIEYDPPDVLQMDKPENLQELLEEDKELDVLLIKSDTFAKILSYAGLKREQTVFNKLKKTWLDHLIFNRKILEIKERK